MEVITNVKRIKSLESITSLVTKWDHNLKGWIPLILPGVNSHWNCPKQKGMVQLVIGHECVNRVHICHICWYKRTRWAWAVTRKNAGHWPGNILRCGMGVRGHVPSLKATCHERFLKQINRYHERATFSKVKSVWKHDPLLNRYTVHVCNSFSHYQKNTVLVFWIIDSQCNSFFKEWSLCITLAKKHFSSQLKSLSQQ